MPLFPGIAIMSMGIVEFSKLAGVSVATVSRAFTGNGRISEKTSDRILRLASKHGFTPNVHASRLSSRESKSIGLMVIVSQDSPRHGEIRELVLDVSSVILENGYSANVMVSANLKDRIFQRIITGGAVDGILLASEENQPSATLRRVAGNLPCVLLGFGKQNVVPGLGLVSVASRDGMACAVARLTELGHRKIAFIDDSRDEDKFVGYKKGIYLARIPFEPSLIETTEGHFEDGSLAIRKLLGRRSFTAVVCASDILALGAMAAIQDTGRLVPGDCSIVGFGDLDAARWSKPSLTSLHINRRELGLAAVTVLTEMIQEGKRRKTVVPLEIQPRWLRSVQPILIERESIGIKQRLTTQFQPSPRKLAS